MKKFLKVVGVIIAVIAALMFIVPMALSSKIGDIVKTEANKMVAEGVSIDFEKLDISLFRHFPKASLELVDFEVTVAAAEPKHLVSAERIEVAVDLFSIFGDSFTISKVWLKRPEIYAEISKEGKPNWDIMKQEEAEPVTESVTAESETEEAAAADSSSFKLSMESIAIDDAVLHYTDYSTNMHFHTQPLTVLLSGDLSAAESELSIDAKAADITFVSGENTFASSLTAALSGTVAANLVENRFTLNGVQFSVNDVTARLNGWAALAGDDIEMDIELDCSQNNFKSILSLVPVLFTRDFKDLTAVGNVSLKASANGTYGKDMFPSFEVALNVDKGSFKYADLPKSVSDIVIDLAVTNSGGSLDNTVVKMSKMSAAFGGQSFAASLTASKPLSDLNFDASFDGTLNLSAVKDIYPLGDDMALNGVVTAKAAVGGSMALINAKAFDKMRVSGKVAIESLGLTYGSLPPITIKSSSMSLTPTKISLDALALLVGRSDLSAKGSLQNYWGYLLKDDTLSGTLSLNSSLLDLNEIMESLSSDSGDEESVNEAESAATEEPTAEEVQSAASVIEVPKNLALTLNSSLKKVVFQKMNITNLNGKISMRGGVLSLDNLSMGLFDGKAKATASYSTADVKSPSVKLNMSFTDASFKTTFSELDMMQKVVPIFEKIEGRYAMSLAATMTLDSTMSPVLKTINGNGEINSGNFKISNVKALELLTKCIGGAAAVNLIETSSPTIISFTIRDGGIITKPFTLNFGSTALTLSGTTGLDQSIDYKVKVATPKLTLAGNIGGTFSAPKVKLDAATMVQEALAKVGVSTTEITEKLVAEAEAAGQKLVDAAKAESQKLVDKASNPLAKVAAKAAGQKLVEAAEKQAAALVEKAREKAAAQQK